MRAIARADALILAITNVGLEVVSTFWFREAEPVIVRVLPPPVRVMSEPVTVRVREVVPPATVKPSAAAVRARPFIEVALAAPKVGVVRLGEVARTIEPEPVVEIHPADARRRGIAPDQLVRVHNDRGSVALRCRFNPDLRAGVVVISEGSWVKDFPGGDPYSLTHEQVSPTSENYAFYDNLVETDPVQTTR